MYFVEIKLIYVKILSFMFKPKCLWKHDQYKQKKQIANLSISEMFKFAFRNMLVTVRSRY